VHVCYTTLIITFDSDCFGLKSEIDEFTFFKIPRDFQDRKNEASERGDFNQVNQIEVEEEMKRLLEEIAALENSPRKHRKKKHFPKDSKRKSKSKYPIDEYLNLTKKREEHFSLPSASPPPPSPSAKVMQRAEDLLQAAEYYLSNIRSDLSLGSQLPSEPSQRTEDSSSLCSSLSEEINPLHIKKAVNAALGDIEGRVKSQIQSSAKSDLILSHERVKNSTSRPSFPKTAQEIISIPSNDDLDHFVQPLIAKSSSRSAKVNPAPDLNKTKQSIERTYELAQEVNSNFMRMKALGKELQRSQNSATKTMKLIHPPKSPPISRKKPVMSSAASLTGVLPGTMAPSNTPKFSRESVINDLQLIDGSLRNDKYLSKNSKKHPPNSGEPANHNEDESVSSEIMSGITTDSGTSPKSVKQIIRDNSRPNKKSADIGVNTSYSLLLDIMDAFPVEELNKDCEKRSVTFLTEDHPEDHARRVPSCPKDNQMGDKQEDISQSPKKDNCVTEFSINSSLPAKNQVLPDLPLKVNSYSSPANTSLPILENEESGVEKKIEEKIIMGNSTDDEVQEIENGRTVIEIPTTAFKAGMKENSMVQTDFPTLAEVLENILIHEVRKVAEEVQKSPSRQRENAERLERSISELLDTKTPPESVESSDDEVLSPMQEQLTPLSSEEAIKKLMQLEEQVERISTPVETLREEVRKAILSVHSSKVASLVSERSHISDYKTKELASSDEQQESDTRTKTKILSSSSSTSKLSSVDDPSPPSQIKIVEINDAATNDLSQQKIVPIPKEGQIHEKTTEEGFNAFQSSSIQQERLQNSDITTATSLSMEAAENLSFMDDEPHASFSEGELKIKHSSVQTTNSDLLSEGEIPAPRFTVPCGLSTENTSSEGRKHVTFSGTQPGNLLQSWSEGEVRNRWVLVPAHGSTSTSTNDSKSQGEVSALVMGSIRSHLHIEFTEQEYHLTTVNTPSLSPTFHLHKDEPHVLEDSTFQDVETPCSTPVEVVSTPETSPKRERHQEPPTPLQTPSPTPRSAA
ncbi:hypothetical protein J437_LFUL003024, partial [Ladona fulva]